MISGAGQVSQVDTHYTESYICACSVFKKLIGVQDERLSDYPYFKQLKTEHMSELQPLLTVSKMYPFSSLGKSIDCSNFPIDKQGLTPFLSQLPSIGVNQLKNIAQVSS